MTPAIRYRVLVISAIALGWILFKCGYPYADFFTDSYTYIQAAADHDAISYRPIGYSLFLRLIHAISRSDTLLVTIQFGLVQASCWTLLALIRRQCAPGVRVQGLIAIFLILNPLVYYISNFVSSDALFLALSLFWMTSLMHSMHKPTWQGLVVQWVLLLLIFYTRYVALFYPVVAAISYAWLRRDWRFKLTAMAGGMLIMAAAVLFTRELTRKDTNAATFSAFSGWQIANNALHVYPWVPVDTTGLPPETTTLSGYVAKYFSRAGDALKEAPSGASTTYMWARTSPLHEYFDAYRGRLPYFTAWNRVAPLFSRYGYFVIRRHPLAFCRYYLGPSAESFFMSPLDVLARYLDGKKEIDPIARDWFGYREARPRVISVTLQGELCAPFPWISLVLSAAFAATAGIFLLRRKWRDANRGFSRCLRVAAIYLGMNCCFNVFASPSVYRYQVLPLILLFIFTCCGLFFVTYRKQPGHA